MAPIRWIRYKILSIYIISTIILGLMYIFLYITSMFKGILFDINLLIFIKNLFYIFNIEAITLLFIIISTKIKIMIPLLIIIFFGIFIFLPTNIINLNFLVLLILFIIIKNILFLVYKRIYITVIENN